MTQNGSTPPQSPQLPGAAAPAETAPMPGHSQEMRSGTSLQGANRPAPPRSIGEYISGTLRYIGQHPFQFALSMGASMAIGFGVKVGLIGMGVALGPLGLAVAGAMVTSVILNVGRKLWRGENISLKDLAGKSLFSGIFAGVLGGLFGVSLGEGVNEAAQDVYTGNPMPDYVDQAHGGIDELDLSRRPNRYELPPVETDGPRFEPCYTEVPDYKGIGDLPTDQYAYKIANWSLTESAITNVNQDYVTVGYGDSHTMCQLMDVDKDWVVFQDAQDNAEYMMRPEQLIERAEHAVAEKGLADYENMVIRNVPVTVSSPLPTPLHSNYGYDLHFSVKDIAGNPDKFEFLLNSQLETVKHLQEKPWEVLLGQSHAATLAGTEIFENGNYSGAVEHFVDSSLEKLSYNKSLICYLETARSPEEIKELAENIRWVDADTVLAESSAEKMQAALMAQLEKSDPLNIPIAGDSAPSYLSRIKDALNYAATDANNANIDCDAFAALLQECQAKLDQCGLGNQLNLMQEWEIAQARDTIGQHVGSATDHTHDPAPSQGGLLGKWTSSFATSATTVGRGGRG